MTYVANYVLYIPLIYRSLSNAHLREKLTNAHLLSLFHSLVSTRDFSVTIFVTILCLLLSSLVFLSSLQEEWINRRQCYEHISIFSYSSNFPFTHPTKKGISVNSRYGPFQPVELSVSRHMTNLFFNREPFWSPDWNYPMRAVVTD